MLVQEKMMDMWVLIMMIMVMLSFFLFLNVFILNNYDLEGRKADHLFGSLTTISQWSKTMWLTN